MSERGLLVVAVPFKFNVYDYERFEIDDLRKVVDVVVFDVGAYVECRLFDGTETQTEEREIITRFSVFGEIFGMLRSLRRSSDHKRIVFLNFVNVVNFRTFLFNFLLKVFGFSYIDVYNGGVPVADVGRTVGFLGKVWERRNDLLYLYGLLRQRLFILFSLVTGSAPAYRLVAGDAYMHRFGLPVRDHGVKLLSGSSWDYCTWLRYCRSDQTRMGGRTGKGVLLDGVTPMFGSDALSSLHKIRFTAEAWYPAICVLMDRLEKATSSRVSVAAHPKSKHEATPAYLDYRDVVYGDTIGMIQRSDYVIARNSAAITWAVLFDKPIIFIYSDQLLVQENFMRTIRNMAGFLGTKPVNINRIGDDLPVEELLNYDRSGYRDYVKNYLSSRSDLKTNSDVILEEVFME